MRPGLLRPGASDAVRRQRFLVGPVLTCLCMSGGGPRRRAIENVSGLVCGVSAVVASAAANQRRPRSSSTGASASKRWRMADSSITPIHYRIDSKNGIAPRKKYAPSDSLVRGRDLR
jgi:hypothetical protein